VKIYASNKEQNGAQLDIHDHRPSDGGDGGSKSRLKGKVKRVKISLLQAMETHRVARG
jgi:hypothetical protein